MGAATGLVGGTRLKPTLESAWLRRPEDTASWKLRCTCSGLSLATLDITVMVCCSSRRPAALFAPDGGAAPPDGATVVFTQLTGTPAVCARAHNPASEVSSDSLAHHACQAINHLARTRKRMRKVCERCAWAATQNRCISSIRIASQVEGRLRILSRVGRQRV